MLKRSALVVLLACVVGFLTAPAAFAVQRRDPADTGLNIDISLIKFVEDPEDVATLTIKTHSGWKCRALRPAAKTSLKWFFDGSGGNDFDLVGSFVCRRGTLVFNLRSTDGSNNYEPLVAKRPNRRTVRVTMTLDLPELDSNNLDLIAKSKDTSGETCIEDCVDRAP
ncbi:MAG TPA: hypothetical protein VHN37_03505, partial [Actinomycetota bacterium]|nr:hypothetical protein [Actinomycetota bacterium]